MQDLAAFGLTGRKTVLVVVGIAALVAPAIASIPEAPALRTQSQSVVLAPSVSEFEVASIKLNIGDGVPPLDRVSRTMLKRAISGMRNGRITMQRLAAPSLIVLLQAAYSLKEFQILGAPSWAISDRYDVEARAGERATFEQMRPMLQSLVADRFRLTFHRETRRLPAYDLVAARNGLKISPLREGSCVTPDQSKAFGPLNICGGVRRQMGGPERPDVIEPVGVPMPMLIDFVSDEVGRVVLDKTGFTQLFRFRLEFASNLGPGLLNPETPALSNSSGLSIFTAVEEQLGMRLRSATRPVEVLVIDHVERPSPN